MKTTTCSYAGIPAAGSIKSRDSKSWPRIQNNIFSVRGPCHCSITGSTIHTIIIHITLPQFLE